MANLSQSQVMDINASFWQQVTSDSGREKQAALMNRDIILKVLREDGFSRKFLTYESITPQQLDFDYHNQDALVKFVPVEDPIQGYLANSTDWMQPTKDIWFNSKYMRIKFYPMVSRKIKLTEEKLMASRYPIREYLEGVIKNDFLAVEDFQFIDNIERCLVQQEVLYGSSNTVLSTNTKLLNDDISDLAKGFSRLRLGVDVFMCHEATYYDFLKLKQNDVGSFVMKDIYDSGIVGPNARFKSYMGFKWLLTNNADIIPEKVVYAVAPQKVLGKFYQLQIPQMYIKFENHILEMYARQILGRGIANINAVGKLVLS